MAIVAIVVIIVTGCALGAFVYFIVRIRHTFQLWSYLSVAVVYFAHPLFLQAKVPSVRYSANYISFRIAKN